MAGWDAATEGATLFPVKRASPELEHAASLGVDVDQLLANLALTPAERLRRNAEAVRLMERTRRANLTARQLEALAELERERLRENWGEWLAPLDAL